MKAPTGTVISRKIAVDYAEFQDGTEALILTREHNDDVRLSSDRQRQ